jgi:two-component system LytT family response regulator
MIKAILIDDEPLARSIVKEYLIDYPEVIISQECSDGFEGVKAIADHQPDLIFLDIQMPKINGFEMLELIEQEPAVIFTTAFDEYAIKAFDAHAIDYLLKPFSKERFDKAMEKLINQHQASIGGTNQMQGLLEEAAQQKVQQERVVVKTGTKIKIIPVQDIHYFEADDDYVKIHTEVGRFLKKKTMSYFETSLPASQFVRTHRSYIVQVQQITRIEPYEKDSHIAILKSGARIPISAAGYAKLKVVLGL